MMNGLFDKIALKNEVRKDNLDCSGSCLMLIDMQPYFLEDFGQKSKELIENQMIMMEKGEILGLPLIILEYIRKGETIEPLRSQARKMKPHHFIKKSVNDGFYNTNLETLLISMGIRNIGLMGINASYCVQDTAKSALEYGFNIFTSPKLIANSKYHKEDYHTWFQRKGSYFDSIDPIVDNLTRLQTT